MINKKHNKLALSMLLLSSTVASAVYPIDMAQANTIAFNDVQQHHYFYDAVTTLTSEGVLNGYGDQTFRPDVPTTRGHIAIVLSRVLNLQPTEFVDIADMPESHNTYSSAAAAVQYGLMDLDRLGNFNPKSELSRYEYAEILMRAYDLEPINSAHPFRNVPSKYNKAVQAVYDHGLMRGVSATSFAGNNQITRGQMAVTLINARAIVKPVQKIEEKKIIVERLNISKQTITFEDQTYSIDERLAALFSRANSKALLYAEIEGVFNDGRLVEIKSLTLNNEEAFYEVDKLALDLGGIQISGALTLNQDYVTIKNGQVDQFIIGDGLSSEAALENLQINQLTLLSSSGMVLTLKDVTVKQIDNSHDGLQLISNKKIPSVLLRNDVFDFYPQVAIGHLQLLEDQYVSIEGTISIDKVTIPGKADLTVQSPGFINTVTMYDADAGLNVDNETIVKSVIVPKTLVLEDVLNRYSHLTDYIQTIQYPDSKQNLLAYTIDLPAKYEELRQEALDEMTVESTSTASDNRFQFETKMEVTQLLKDFPVNVIFYVDSGFDDLDDQDRVTVSVSFNGKKITRMLTVEKVFEGFTMAELFNRDFYLREFNSNEANKITLTLGTKYPTDVRAELYVQEVHMADGYGTLNEDYVEEEALDYDSEYDEDYEEE